MKSYEQARNKALELIGNVDRSTAKPHIGNIGIGKNKIVGTDWHGNKVSLRVDYDPIKEPHINVADFRNGYNIHGLEVAIPFNGNEKHIESLLKSLNSIANLERAKMIFEKTGDNKNLAKIKKILTIS